MNDLTPLSSQEITSKLKEISGWQYVDGKISKEFEFPTYVDGLMLVTELGFFSEKIDHHPDIHILYNKIKFELQRFDIGGKVTERDFTVAKKIEEMFAMRK
jgi:4a-hydroxytetrahydrobiopterin dehydratase